MANIKQEASKHYSIRLKKAQYDEIVSYGGGKLADGVKFLLDYVAKNQNVPQIESKRPTVSEDITPKRPTSGNLNDIIDKIMADIPEINNERIPTPKEAIQIKEIDRLTSGGMKTYWEDGEEYTREQLMKRADLEYFI